MTRNRVCRIAAIACVALAGGQAVVLWSYTGGGVLTRYFDPQRAALERASRDIDRLFGEERDDWLDAAPNRFQLGLLPSGDDKHAVSLVTILAPLLFAAGFLYRDRQRVDDRATTKKPEKSTK